MFIINILDVKLDMIKALKNNKGDALEWIIPELLRCGGISKVKEFWRNKCDPDDWRKGLIVKLLVNLTDYNN